MRTTIRVFMALAAGGARADRRLLRGTEERGRGGHDACRLRRVGSCSTWSSPASWRPAGPRVFRAGCGQAKAVMVDIGSAVKAGEVLVEIDTRELSAQLAVSEAALQLVRDQAAQAKTGIETVRANLDLAQKSYDRAVALIVTQSITQGQLDDAQTKLQLARSAFESATQQYQLLSNAGLAQAQAAANLIRVQIANGIVTSPLDGIVTNRNVNPGEVVSAQAALMTVVDGSQLKLQANVAQPIATLLTPGNKGERSRRRHTGRHLRGHHHAGRARGRIDRPVLPGDRQREKRRKAHGRHDGARDPRSPGTSDPSRAPHRRHEREREELRVRRVGREGFPSGPRCGCRAPPSWRHSEASAPGTSSHPRTSTPCRTAWRCASQTRGKPARGTRHETRRLHGRHSRLRDSGRGVGANAGADGRAGGHACIREQRRPAGRRLGPAQRPGPGACREAQDDSFDLTRRAVHPASDTPAMSVDIPAYPPLTTSPFSFSIPAISAIRPTRARSW